MINLHIEANSVEELKNQMRELLGSESTIQAQLLNMCNPKVPDQTMADAIVDALMPKTSGSTEVEPQPEFVTQDIAKDLPTVQPKQEQPAKTYSLVDVRAAANAYRDKHGIEKLREIFKKHGGEKLKDIPESNYAALMEDIA